jgi:hypothetical protein
VVDCPKTSAGIPMKQSERLSWEVQLEGLDEVGRPLAHAAQTQKNQPGKMFPALF